VARRDTAARRYAEAAFEVAMRDGTVEVWRRELAEAAAVLAEPGLARVLANPAIPMELRSEMVGDAVGRPVEGSSVDVIGQLLERIGRLAADRTLPLSSRLELAVAAISHSVSRPVLNLITLLVRRGRIELLPQVAQAFARLDDARQEITHATVTSAAPLTPDEVQALTQRLEQSSGGRISLDVQVDPSLLGGLVVRVGDRLIDGSVRGRLERLRNQLTTGAL
jgi:F-type H+-transporting ATPase subunit delta